MRSREIRLASRPAGFPRESDFALAETDVPDPGAGEALVRNVWMSVDPYMRGRMRDAPSYVPPFELGKPLQGDAVGRVAASGDPGLAEGDWVLSPYGWREWLVAPARRLQRLDPGLAPVQTALGVLGMPGLTAYVGLLDVGALREGDTVFVTAAAGAVGSVAGQIARLKGAGRVIGSAGSAEKVGWLSDELGFDAAFDYREADARAALREAAPEGIDLHFENVGGPQLEAAISAMRAYGRIVLCGLVSQYNLERPEPGPSNLFLVTTRRLTMRGFIVSDHADRREAFLAEAVPWVRDGLLRSRETVFEGIERAPAAFLALLRGDKVGKVLVRLGPD